MIFIILSILFWVSMIALTFYTSSKRWFRNHESFHWLHNLSTILVLISSILVMITLTTYSGG